MAIKKYLIAILLSLSLFAQAQDGESVYREIDWWATVVQLEYLTDSTYRFQAYPLNLNDPGALMREIGNYVVDNVGHRYKIIDSDATTITVLDEYRKNIAPQTAQPVKIYRSVYNGEAPYIGGIDWTFLDKSMWWKVYGEDMELMWRQTIDSLYDIENDIWLYDGDTLPTGIDTFYDADNDIWIRSGDTLPSGGSIDTFYSEYENKWLYSGDTIKMPEGTSHDPVTIVGTPDYIQLTGPQEITRYPIDLSTDVTGTLPAVHDTAEVLRAEWKQDISDSINAIPPVDLSAYWKRDGTSTATGNWDLEDYEITMDDATISSIYGGHLYFYSGVVSRIKQWEISNHYYENGGNDNLIFKNSSGDKTLELQQDNNIIAGNYITHNSANGNGIDYSATLGDLTNALDGLGFDGTGTENYLTMFGAGGTSLVNSPVYTDASKAGISVSSTLPYLALIDTDVNDIHRIESNSGFWSFKADFNNSKSGTAIRWYTDGVENMRLNNTGNLLIGTTTDNGTDKLQVNGTTYFNSPLGNGFEQGINVADLNDALSGLGGGTSMIDTITQTSHGLAVDDWVRNTSGTFQKAQANSAINADVIGVVNEVIDANTFVYQFGGIYEGGSYTDGTNYYLSTDVAGDAATQSQTYDHGEVRTFLGTGVPNGLLLEIDLGELIDTTALTSENVGNQISDSLANIDLADYWKNDGTSTQTGDWSIVKNLNFTSHSTEMIQFGGVDVLGSVSGAPTLAAYTSGGIRLRPGGMASSSGEFYIAPSGAVSTSSSITAGSLVKSGATSDDILLGDGTTTSLSGLGSGGATIDTVIYSLDTLNIVEDGVSWKVHIPTSNDTTQYIYTTIVAEEGGAVSSSTNSGYQWSYGNGDESQTGVTVAFDCELVAMSFRTDVTTTATVTTYKNGVATGGYVSLSAGVTGYREFSPVSVSAGDYLAFRTTSGSNTGAGATVTMVLRQEVAAVKGEKGDKGDTGADGFVGFADKTYLEDGVGTVATAVDDSTYRVDILQNVQNGDKTASFVFNADTASIGNFNLSTTNAVIISIHNLESGDMGTIFVDIGASAPSSVSVTGYSDAGSTQITNKINMNDVPDPTTNKMMRFTYTCASDGTNLELIMSYAIEP